MKIALQICNQRTISFIDTMLQFRIIFRSASFSSHQWSKGALQLRSSSCCSSFSNSRTSFAMTTPLLRLMSSRPPPLQTREKVPSLTNDERMTLVRAEYELYKSEGEVDVPSHIEEREWLQLAQLPSVGGRKKFLRFLFVNEMKAINKKKKSLMKRNFAKDKYEKLQAELSEEEGYLSYGLWRNTIFTKWSNQRMNHIESQRVLQAKLFGQPIVFDYDFDKHMVQREKTILGRQVAECIGLNRSHREPFYLHMCNFRQNEGSAISTLAAVPTLLKDDFLVDVHSQDYMDIFPQEKLVYLTPHCKEEMGQFDHDAVYIIGSLIDTRCSEPITLAKAKKQKIKMRKLPLDKYLDWGMGKKSLTLNQMLAIMLEIKSSGSWEQAFMKHIPPRKLIKTHDLDAAAIKKKMRGSKQEPKLTGRLVRSLFKD